MKKQFSAAVFSGPPVDKNNDGFFLKKFLEHPGKLIVCGGTSAKIVSQYLGCGMNIDLKSLDPDVPPLFHIDGIDLVTEGILTLTKAHEYLKSGIHTDSIKKVYNGSAALLNLLLPADHVHFFIGQTKNPVHFKTPTPLPLNTRMSVIGKIGSELMNRGKEVSIELD